MRVGLLGEAEVWLGEDRVRLSSPRLRQIVSALALARGRPVSYDALVDVVWGDHPPESLPGTLHAYIAGLRKAFEPDRAPRTPPTILLTVGTGYALAVQPADTDVARFETAVTSVDRRLARADVLSHPPLAVSALEAAAAELDAALGLWRGEAYADLGDLDVAVAERARLDGLRVLATEDRASIGLALGGHGPVAAELEALTSAHPLRERPWALRALALNAGGRQADALEVLRQFAAVLDEELGMEPTPDLRRLQTRILQHDPALRWHEHVEQDVPRVAAVPPLAPSQPEQPPGPALDAEVPVSAVSPVSPGWRMVGRDSELAALTGLLDPASAGRPAFAVLTGEPGIGKTRLCAELAGAAGAYAARVAVGRCSQDDGAPPLWPWRQVLAALGRELVVPGETDPGAAFRTAELVVDQLREASRDELVVVVLDDLHWSDTQTLRVLRLLTETLVEGRLLVVATWRDRPEPEGALAEVAGALSRAHALRVDLRRLPADAAARLLGEVSEREVADAEVALVLSRTDGNPFYLVEFARLARQDELTADRATTPTAVSDVVRHRLGRLPGEAAATLRVAAVVGRTFDLDTLTLVSGEGEDELLEHLDAATDAGLLREDGVGRWSFDHALVRDTAYASLGATRAARAHAAAAGFLADRTGAETEVAHHWLAAGPAHAAQAWRAARRAATAARLLHGHEEAAELLRRGIAVVGMDPTATPMDRYDLLMDLAETERASGQWTRLKEASEAALDVAESLGDLERVARAASAMTHGAFWQTTTYGEVHERQAAALRRCLDELPSDDSPLRCGVMSSLAMELYYAAAFQEREALVEQSLAMARRIGDPSLWLDAALAGFIALWQPSTRHVRLELAEDAVPLARELGDDTRLVIASTLLVVAQSECGLVEQMWESYADARAQAQRLRLPYGLFVLDALAVPWLGMMGRAQESREKVAALAALSERVVLFQADEAMSGALLGSELWSGDVGALVPFIEARLEEGSVLPVDFVVCQLYLRAGDPDGAARLLERRSPRLPDPDWFSILAVAGAAETALGVGDPELGRQAYEQLAPYAGQSCQTGSAMAIGPVDAFLALAAAAVGELDLASRHADDAEALMRRWRVPRCAEWFSAQRERHGF